MIPERANLDINLAVGQPCVEDIVCTSFTTTSCE